MSKPNFCLVSSDDVQYHVHRQALGRSSSNLFNLLLKNESSASVPEKSAVLSIILHAIYEMSFGSAECGPSLSALITSVNLFPKYGLEAKTCLKAGTHLYNAVFDYSPHTPLLVFTFAARLDLEDLAVASSEYTLSCTPNDITEGMLNDIGTRYLRRLFQLQRRRTEALRNLLLAPLQLHPSVKECPPAVQVRTNNDWKRATASLVYTAHPTMSCQTIDATYKLVVDHVECEHCRENINSRVKSLLVDWSNEKVS
ncbi:hypothetical protein BDZ89DRAFT_948306 [Hymenopellis radicata]|nr:hypothetical protein BDZ89DRAFT_948306 [Hymenopellis radicata]